MKLTLIFALCLGLGQVGFTQEIKPAPVGFQVADVAPQLSNGESLQRYAALFFKQNLDKAKLPPALRSGQRVVISFVVDSLGRAGNAFANVIPKVTGSLPYVKITDLEISRVVGMMPRAIPGKFNGKDVSVQITVPLL